MRRLSAVLAAIFTVLALLVAYFFVGGTLRSQVSVETASAADWPDAFSVITGMLEKDGVPQKFRTDVPADASACTLTSITVDLQNYGMLNAEWLEIRVTPASSDIAVYSVDGESATVSSFSSGRVNLKLLSYGTGPRTVEIGYYVFGMHRTISVAVNG